MVSQSMVNRLNSLSMFSPESQTMNPLAIVGSLGLNGDEGSLAFQMTNLKMGNACNVSKANEGKHVLLYDFTLRFMDFAFDNDFVLACLLLNGHNSRSVYRHYRGVIFRDDSDAEECTGGLEEELVRKRSTIVDTDSVGVVFDVGFLNKKHDMCCVGVYKDDYVDLASVGKQADNVTEAYGDIGTDAAIMREGDHETATKGLQKSRGVVLSKVVGGRNVVEQDSATPFGHGNVGREDDA
ncbi:hypothetical protein POM88_010547 [Heracleum sosnowskyi]|uniref:Uncharacterized protein n=1 Tax=Heracleum sosnowskyi TaxID=360622 RepID=A0AAD8ITP4_9APIA|nr:hypothetical protein POM88_010547 [Heracleum sosnowskyi]